MKHIAAVPAVAEAHYKPAVEGAEEPGKQVVLAADIVEVVPNIQAELAAQLGVGVGAAAAAALLAVGLIVLVDIAVVLADSFAGTELAVPEVEPVAIVIAEPVVESAEYSFELVPVLQMQEPVAEEAGRSCHSVLAADTVD